MSAKELQAFIDGYAKCNPPFLPSLVMDALRSYAALLSCVEDGEGIVRELEECERIVGNLCADGRCPKMSIPVRDDDEDMRLTRTMKQAAARITLDAQEKAALKGQADVLDALNTSQAHEIALLKAELASVKDHAEANAKTRATVDYLLAQAGFAEDSSVRNLLGCMNFDAARITLDAQEKAALQAELARLKEVAHNNAERSNANYVAMQSALEFIDLTIERREAFADYRAAHPKEGA